MKLFGTLIATAALGAALVASGPAAAFRGGGWDLNDYSSGYGYPSAYSSGYGYPYDTALAKVVWTDLIKMKPQASARNEA